MEWLFSKAARTLLHMSNRLPHSSPLFQKRTFQSISSLHADLTIATPQTDSPARSYPRSEAGSLLGLDTPESSNSRTARHIAASAASKARAVAKEPSSAKKAIILKDNRDLEGLMYRKWQAGDVYTPHDLTPREIREYKTAKSPSRDIFDSLGINPLDYYKVCLELIVCYGSLILIHYRTQFYLPSL